MTDGGMKNVAGTVIATRPYLGDDDRPDWHFDHCICADIPDEKRIDLQERRFNKQRKKWRWVSVDTTHQDCPVHGIDPEARAEFAALVEERDRCPED